MRNCPAGPVDWLSRALRQPASRGALRRPTGSGDRAAASHPGADERARTRVRECARTSPTQCAHVSSGEHDAAPAAWAATGGPSAGADGGGGSSDRGSEYESRERTRYRAAWTSMTTRGIGATGGSGGDDGDDDEWS